MTLKEKVAELHHQGFTPQEIGVHLNLHVEEVQKLLPEDIEYGSRVEHVVNVYLKETQYTAKELAPILGVSYQYLARCLKDAGIDISERTERLRQERKEEAKKILKEMYEENLPLSEMQEVLGISSTTLREYAKEMGITLRSMRTNRRKEQMEYLMHRRLGGATYKEIAEELGISYNYALNLASYARNQGVPIPNQRKEE